MIPSFSHFHRIALAAIALALLCKVSPAGPRNPKYSQDPDFVLEGHTDDPLAVAFFPDGKQLVSGGMDRNVCIWDLPTRKLVRILAGHSAPVRAVAVSADGKLVASGSSDHSIRIWDAKTGDQVGQLDGHTGDVCGVAFLANGQLLSGARNGLRIWNIADEKAIWNSQDAGISHLAVSRDGKRCAYSTDGTSGVYDLVDHKRLCEIAASIIAPQTVAISRDGKYILACVGGNTSKYAWFDIETNTEIEPNFSMLESFAISDDGSVYVIGSMMAACTFDAVKNKQGMILPVKSENAAIRDTLRAVAISPDGQTVAMAVGGRRNGFGWDKGLRHSIQIVSPNNDVPAPRLGPVAGKISWEVVPLTVKQTAGQMTPFSECKGMFDEYDARAESVGPDLDVIMFTNAIYFHRKQGFIEELLGRPMTYRDFAWDGKRLWVATLEHGIRLVNRDGTPGPIIGTKEGLPDGMQNVRLISLGPGKILAAGSAIVLPTQNLADGTSRELPVGSGRKGWIAVVENTATGSVLKIVYRGEQLPADWPDGFKPIWITRPPLDSGDHSIWIGCAPSGKSAAPILRLDPTTFAPTFYNIAGPQIPAKHTVADVTNEVRNRPPLFIDGHTLLRLRQNLSDFTAGDSYIDGATEKVLLARRWNDAVPFLANGDRIVIPGRNWLAVNPKKLEAENLGPGLRVEGKLVAGQILYFDSAILGLAGISRIDGCMYRFSVDGAHPLPIHATDDPPPVRDH